MPLPRSVELQCQEEMIARWLSTPGVPDDVRSELLEMLSNVHIEQSTSGKRSITPS